MPLDEVLDRRLNRVSLAVARLLSRSTGQSASARDDCCGSCPAESGCILPDSAQALKVTGSEKHEDLCPLEGRTSPRGDRLAVLDGGIERIVGLHLGHHSRRALTQLRRIVR